MADPINLSTAGVHMWYGVETVAGTMPEAGWVDLLGVKSTPSLNPAPDALEATDLNQTKYKTYVQGLKDLGGSLEFTFNLTEEFITLWDGLISAFEAGKASSPSPKATWFAITVPGLSKAFVFKGTPSDEGLPAIEVNNVLETTAYITPTSAPTMVEKSKIKA